MKITLKPLKIFNYLRILFPTILSTILFPSYALAVPKLVLNADLAKPSESSQPSPEQLRMQKLSDINVMLQFKDDNHSVKYIDIENLEMRYRDSGRICGDSYCDDTYITCKDIFTRRQSSTDNLVNEDLNGLQALYFDRRVCETVQVNPSIN